MVTDARQVDELVEALGVDADDSAVAASLDQWMRERALDRVAWDDPTRLERELTAVRPSGGTGRTLIARRGVASELSVFTSLRNAFFAVTLPANKLDLAGA